MAKNKERQERIERLYPAPAGQGDPAVQEAAASYNDPPDPPPDDVIQILEREITDTVSGQDL